MTTGRRQAPVRGVCTGRPGFTSACRSTSNAWEYSLQGSQQRSVSHCLTQHNREEPWCLRLLSTFICYSLCLLHERTWGTRAPVSSPSPKQKTITLFLRKTHGEILQPRQLSRCVCKSPPKSNTAWSKLTYYMCRLPASFAFLGLDCAIATLRAYSLTSGPKVQDGTTKSTSQQKQ